MTAAMQPTRYLKLPIAFDLARLQEDLQRIASADWIGHFNTSAYEKGWGCVPLRSVEGRTDHIMPVNGGRSEDMSILARCPYFRQAIPSSANSAEFWAMDSVWPLQNIQPRGA